MPPKVALILCLLFIAYNLARDLSETSGESKALWLPSIWVGLSLSRPPSLWFNPHAISIATGEGGQGNLLDRGIFVVLFVAGLLVLFAQKNGRWQRALFGAPFLLLFFGYCALSIVWSDVPLYSLRRFVKFSGMIMMILIVVSETKQLQAVTRIIRRSAYVLVPISLLFIKYYPNLGRGYDPWTGLPANFGVAFDKNMLGKMCLAVVVVLTASIICRGKEQPSGDRMSLWIDIGILGITLYLFSFTNSATSEISAIVGVGFLLALKIPYFRRYAGLWLFVGLFVVLSAEVMYDVSARVAEEFGRDPTLTNRTEIWSELIDRAGNPLVGTGYESFWTGPRLAAITLTRHINEAHNGFLEVYLNLGLIGLGLVGILLLSTYRRARELLNRGSPFGGLALTLWVVVLTYDITEAGLSGQNIVLFLFLLLAVESKRILPEETDAANIPNRFGISERPTQAGI